MKKIALIAVVLIAALAQAQVNIVPKPVSLKTSAGKFILTKKTTIVAGDEEDRKSASFLNDYLQQIYGFKLDIDKNEKKNFIRISTKKFIKAPDKDAYSLDVTSAGVVISGDTYTGSFYGIQTLIQLLPLNQQPANASSQLQVPFVSIQDYPRFGYRGMHLDVCRHFFPVSFVKKYIDYLALHKMNYFHWHLTEDQGWRIEIKKYPNLTKVGAWRNGTLIGRYPGKGSDETVYGGYYTQDEIREVVDYAAKRFITIIPEIEMPGHSSAAIAAYPFLSCFPTEPTKFPPNMMSKKTVNELMGGKMKFVQETWGVFEDVYCAGKDSTFLFLQDVLDEVMALFPSKYIHVGGDESPKANWKRCPFCQKRIKDEHLKDEHELQSYFIQRIEKYLNSKGRMIIGWDEILEGGLAPNAAVMSWRGEAGGIAAAKQHHNAVMTPGAWCYFDHSQNQNEDSITFGGYTPIEKVYSYEPVPASLSDEEGKFILGAQGNVWTEYIANERKLEYMVFPRIAALSEVLWSGKQSRDWNDFERRLQTQFKRYDAWKINYSRAYLDLRSIFSPTKDFNGVNLTLSSKTSAQIYLYDSSNKQLATGQKTVTYKISKSGLYTGRLVSPAKAGAAGVVLNSATQRVTVNKATGKNIILLTPPSPSYPGDGPFTLVNGIQNDKALARSQEFLGFTTDCIAVIDLGKSQQISSVKVHTLDLIPSWIWRPQYVEVLISSDGANFLSVGTTDVSSTPYGNGVFEKTFDPVKTRFVKIFVKNNGEIAPPNPGAGNKAWLFVDEIEIF